LFNRFFFHPYPPSRSATIVLLPFGQDRTIIPSQPPRLRTTEIIGLVHAWSNPAESRLDRAQVDT
jgi:hypothetical protein